MTKRLKFTKKDIERQIKENGYAICPNVLTQEEIKERVEEMKEWQNINQIDNTIIPHGIYKHHEVGHQRFAWKIRINKSVKSYFEYLWKSKDLVVSFDGSCFIPKSLKKKDTIWTHTDQAPNKKGLHCIQGFVSLTSNKERTLVVYDKSHELHAKYFEDRGIKSSTDWFKIDPEFLKQIQDKKRILTVPAGSLVLWDSRTFHQNQYGEPQSEDRMVQYVCYLPRNNPKYTQKIKEKREKYFIERRTTSHWPYPVKVNGLQPSTYGDDSKKIDYSILTPPNLKDMESEIKKLL